eukprot:5607272-Amphidinium_carterae.1
MDRGGDVVGHDGEVVVAVLDKAGRRLVSLLLCACCVVWDQCRLTVEVWGNGFALLAWAVGLQGRALRKLELAVLNCCPKNSANCWNVAVAGASTCKRNGTAPGSSSDNVRL